VQKCIDYEEEVVKPRDRSKKTWGMRLQKKIVRPDKYARKMLWTTGNEES